jgi:2-dehydropantoate 2-reductase
MRIAVIGAGAVGGTFGARLAQAGEDVTFVARGATLAALRQSGLHLDSIDGDLHLASVKATDDPAAVGPVDVVLVAVKATQLAAVAPTLRPLLGPATAVVPLQNGVEASAQLAGDLGDAHVLEGLCRVMAEQTAPGRLRHLALTPVLEVGTRGQMPAEAPARRQLEPLVRAVTKAGMTALQPERMDVALWEKFLFIEPFGTVGGATRAPMGAMRALPATRGLLDACLREVQAVGVASGVPLSDEALGRTWSRYEGLPPGSTASMQRDLMAGRPSELEQQTGSVVRLGHRHGVPTPVHDVLLAVLLLAGGRPPDPGLASAST